MRFVSLLELGRHMPTINTMQKLARGLGMPLSDLVREAEDEPPQE
jgi:transcriptional regulator with XRE-family HTH domain